MAHLKILTGNQKGEKIEIDRDRVVVGRSSKNVVCIEDPSVSGEHCAVVREGRKFIVQDMGSTNGTRLNDVSITEYTLSPKDVIRVGAVELMFDGKDVDPRTEVSRPAEDTQVTVRIEATDKHPAVAATASFEAKSGHKWATPALIVVAVVLVVGALGWFLFKLLG